MSIITKEQVGIGLVFTASNQHNYKVTEQQSDGKYRIANQTPGFKTHGSWQTAEYIADLAKIIVKHKEEVIEVGDIIDGISVFKQKVLAITNDGNYTIDGGEISKYKAVLVSKGNKREIVGYELLKDLPGIPAGTKSDNYTSTKLMCTFQYGDNVHNISYRNLVLQDITWFKPIYKKKEVVVKISNNRELLFKNDTVSIYQLDRLSAKKVVGSIELEIVIKILADMGCTVKKTYSEFETRADSITMGCQTFNQEDIQLIVDQLVDLKLI